MPARDVFAVAPGACTQCDLRASLDACSPPSGSRRGASDAQSWPASIGRVPQSATRRRNIYRGNDPSKSVAIICEGWACAYISLPSGKRQILNFLLPGDLTSAAAVFQEQSGISVEAVTDLRYCVIDKAELRSALLHDPNMLDDFSRRWAAHEEEIGRLATDLGHKSAEQRIARLILNLMERHRARNLLHDGRFDFPLRQQHIADAAGLTVVHVNRVLGAMRRNGVVEIKGRTLSVFKQLELEQIAQ